MSQCQYCGEDLLEDSHCYYDGQVVTCLSCGMQHRVCCDSESPIELEMLEER